MENQDQNTNVTYVSDGNGVNLQSPDQPLVGSSLDSPQALSLDSPVESNISFTELKRSGPLNGAIWRIFLLIILLLVIGLAVVLGATAWSKKNRAANGSALNVTTEYATQSIPLSGFSADVKGVNFGNSKVVINGPLTANSGFVITPSVQPNNPTTGQFYLDQNTGQLAYFNGKAYVPLGGASVQSLGGVSGALDLGNGLRMEGNTLQNAGVVAVTAGAGITATRNVDGTVTIANAAVDGNVVTTDGGMNGTIALFTAGRAVGNSLLSQSGGTVAVAGNLSVDGGLTLVNQLGVASGGTGVASLAVNGVVVGNGSAPVSSVTAGAAGLCLVSTASAPVFTTCPGAAGSVISVNGLAGVLTIANASAAGNTITINDASDIAKGIASFNSDNLVVTSGEVNTVQNISSTASPTFAGVNTNIITPSGALTIGSVSQSFTVQGTASSVFTVSGNGFNTNLGFAGTATGNVNYNLDRGVTPGTYGICTTAGNCVGVGGGITTPGGSTNRLSKFNGSQSLIDSSVSDDGLNVTVNGTANLVVQGGSATLGTLTQAGSLVLSDGNAHTAALVISGLTANRTYTIPDAGSNATFCLSSGNCVGGGGTGAAPNGAEYLVANLNGTLTNERALAAGANLSLTDGGANSTLTVATVQNPSFSTSVTTPLLQSSGALTISSAAGQVLAVDAGSTIELQDDTNVTGNFDVSGSLRAGTGNAFQVSGAGSITAATGITSSGTITFSGLNCTGNANGGALTTNGSGQLICSDDDGGAGGITGSGTSGTVALFNGTQTITNSVITQSGSTVTIAGDLTLTTDLAVSEGGTGASSFTSNGVIYGNGSGALQVTGAGTSGQVLVADAAGVPAFMTLGGDVSVSNTGVVAIQPNSITLGTDTTGNYVANLGTLTGLSTSGNTGEGSTPTLSVNYGSIANTAVQGNVTLTCASGTGNLGGGGNGITLGAGGSCNNITISDSPTFATSITSPSFILTGAGSNGTIQVGNLGQGTVYTLPDPGAAAATICLSTGNCGVSGAAGGDLTGNYPNPTIAKLQGTNLTISGPTAGQVLVYNATNSAWENHAVSGDIAISETGTATIQANSVALGTDTTGNYVLSLTAGPGTSITGSAGEGWTPTVSVLYGSSAGTAVEGDQTITVAAGTNLTGGGAITLGAGGSVTLNVASSPTFSGTLTVQGATATIGTSSQQGSVVLNDGSSNTGTLQTASLAQNTTFTLPDPGASSATICLSTGNCAGAGGGVLTGGGTADRLSKFNGSQSITDSSITDNGTTVTINGSVNLVVQGGTSTLGTTTQAGTLNISDGSSNMVSIVASALSANRVYMLPDAGGDATLCVDSGNCIGGTGGAPNSAQYLVAALDGTLTNERALATGTNLTLTDGGANGNMTVATINNPSFSTSVTTPVLQSSGALTISSGATTVAIDATTTIELQDSTNVTGNLDVSGSFTTGNANAFQISAAGAISSATGITSSGTITFSGLNCSTNANGGALTTNGSGQLICSDDDGGSGSAISGSGTSGTITMFSGTQTITDSIMTQSGGTITIAGDLVLNTDLSVANGGTGAGSFTSNGVIYGNGAGALQVTAAGTGGQVLVASAGGTPTFVSFSGDVAVSATGVATIQADSVALGADTTGNYVANLGSLTGLSTSGNTGEGSTPTLSVNYGSVANTAVQGNVTLTCASGTGNLSGGGTTITLGTGGSCGAINTVNNPTFSTSVTTPSLILTGAGSNGTIQVGALGQGTVYTLPDPGGAAATICISTGNCAATGSAGGDLTGTYPNPTIAKLQGTNLTIAGPTGGQILVYNGTNGAWENHAVSGDIAISESGAATIQANSVALGTDTTGNYVLSVAAGTGVNVSGSAGEGWTPSISVAYGSSAGTAVQGNTSLSVTAGTNLTGGGSVTLGSGGTVTLNVASSPTFSGTLTVQGATATIGTAALAGSVVLNDGTGEIGAIQTANLGQNTTFTLPDPGSSSATICLSTGNCAGSGTGVTTSGGTLNRLSKFTASQAIGDSSISDSSGTVTINGSVNLVVQGGTSTLGTTSQAGTLVLSDGSSNTVSIVAGNFSSDHTYTLPDVGGNATFCLSTGNCIGGGGGGAPADAAYLVTTLNGNLSNERALTAGSNISFTDGGADGPFTIATVNNPTFTTSITTPALQSSGVLTISSAAGQIIAINAGASIELQDSTNVTGNLDVSVGLKAGTADAFQVTAAGAIAAATGITSSGVVTFSGLNCSVNANGGALTTDASGTLICSDDDGGAAGAISGSGTSGTITMFNGTQTIANSVITQAGSTINITGNLTLSTDLAVSEGGTGVSSFTANGIVYGNGASALQVTAAGTSGQVLVAGAIGTPGFVTFSGDVTVSNTGATTIQADSVALGTDTTGNYVANLGSLTGLSTSGNTGEGSTPTLSVSYGSIANTAVQGNVTLNCASGTGNLSGGGTSITLGTGGTCGAINTVNNPTFSTSVTSSSFILTGAGSNGTIQVASLGQSTVYTLPDPGSAAATICLSTGNCSAGGSAGGDLTGTYPNPTIAKLQNSNLTISGPSAGEVLVYNGTNSRWENHAVSGDVVFSETGVAAIQANSVALGTDTTGNYVATLGTLTGLTTSGNTGEGSTPTLSVSYGSSAGTAVQGNTSLSVTAGTNLTGGGSVTLGSGGTVTLNVASSPTFSGTLTVQGASVTVGGAAQQGSVILNDGSANTGTLQTAALGQDTTFTLPDPGASSATICLSTGNCAGVGGGVTTSGGTTNRLSKFTGSQAIGDSSISDTGGNVTINGSVNLVVQGGTSTLGLTNQAGTLNISDGSSNMVSIVAAGQAADRIYTLPDAGGNATFCLSIGNCIGAGGSAPADATYLVATLSGNLTDERALAAGTNISVTDGGANGNMTVATVNNPSFSTSVTTPVLQSSGALTISSGASTVAIDATTTIELQDSTNVTGNIDISGSLTAGTSNAFTVSSAGAITAATGITSSGNITFSGLNCSTNANGGALTTNGSGQLICSDDDGGSGSAISGSGTSGTIALFSGTQTIGSSVITQSGTTITIAGDLTLNTALTVANGGTGAASFTSNGVVYGNGTGALQVTGAGTSGQVLVAGSGGTPTFVSFSGDVTVSSTGATTIQADSVALGTDTTGNYVANLGTLTGLSTSGNTGEGSTPTLSVNYGSIANTAVQGNVTITCASGTGNLSGGGSSITLGAGGSCGAISTVNDPTFSTSVTTPDLILTGAGSNGTIQVGALGQGTVYTLPDPGGATATICISTGNCSTAGSAGGDLTGTYPNPTIAKLQGTNLTISGPTAGQILVYNNTNSRWENHSVSGDIAINESGVAAIQANAVALGTDTTGNYVLGLTAGTGTNVTGTAGEGWSPTVSVLYGSSAGTAVEGSTSISVSAGTNLTGGGSITLGSGGTVTLNIANSPTFSGTLTVQGATATIGTSSQQGSVVLSDGSSNTGTVQTAALGQNTTFTLPDPGASSATICLSTGNCAGSGSGVTTTGGTTNRVSKFTGSQSLGDSSISDNGTDVTINGSVNIVVQGGTSTLGTTTQAGTLKISDGSSNTVSIVATGFAADHTYTLPDVGGNATFCLSTGNCIGGGGGGAPADATYLVASLHGSLTDERALAAGTNISFTDGGANGNFTVATVNNPTFSTSVTTPVLQSSGALTISSGATTVAIDATTTIELQDSTNVTGALDVSAGFTAGTSNAFAVSSGGAITAATGVTSSGTITFSGLNCTGNANGGALTTNGSGQLICSDDDGGAAGAISGSGTSGTVALFSGTQTIGNSIVTQSGTTITIAGDLSLSTALTVGNGGTGATSFTSNGVLYGNGSSALQVTATGTSGQVLVAGSGGTPAFVTFSGDVAVSNTGVTTIQANSVALGTDTTGNYVATLGSLTGLTTSGNTGEGSTPTLSVSYGSIANTAVQGNVTLTCPSGSGNLTGGGTSITLGTGGTCGALSTVNNPTFSTSVTTPSLVLTGAGSNGSIAVGTLGQSTVYTLPDPGGAAATICLSTGNCSTAGSAGGDLTGTYPNPTIAKLQNTNLNISSPAAGHVLVYNGTNSRWENHAVSADVVISETGVATIQANAVALGADTTGNYVAGLSAGTGTTVSGSAGEGWSPAVNITYGSSASTSVEGNTSISVSAGTNLTGGGSITLGAGGTVTLNVANSPTFSGTLTVQGATVTVGGNSQQGSVVLSDGAVTSKTATLKTSGALGQNTTFNLPDPGASSATICLSTGNCAGSGSGVTTSGGTTNRLSKFTGAQAIGDSSISDTGGNVTINGSVNLVVQGGTSTLGTTSQAGTLSISDGSSNTISIVAAGTAADRTYTLPDVGSAATFCLSTGNCIGAGGGSAPSDATYLVATLNGNLSNERALATGTNLTLTDGGANGNMTVATINNPSFSTSVTTPVLQSSGALTISSGATTVAIDATTTIELQDSTNVTGTLDVSAGFNAGTSNAFTISSAGAITAATGVTSSGTITFSGLNCTGNANGGALTTNGSGVLTCSDDDGAAANTITGTGTTNTIALFSGSQAIGNSVITQSGTTINIAGNLTLNTDLAVSEGGTGASSFTSNGVIYGNASGALQVTNVGTGGQVLVANGSGVPTFVSFSGDVAVSATGVATIQADSVALGADTTGNYVATLGSLTGLSTSGNTGEGSTPTLSVSYGSSANTAVQGNTSLTCPSGTGNLTGGGTSITLGTGGTCGSINTVASPTFTGTVTVQGAAIIAGGNSTQSSLILNDGAATSKTITVKPKTNTFGQNTTFNLPDPGAASADFCLSTGNCGSLGSAGGDLTGSYPNPTIAKLQGGTLNITSVAAGHVLIYNATNSRWENHTLSGDIAINETGTTTIQANSVALTTDTTGNYVAGLTAGNGINVTGSAGEGWSPTVAVLYGSSTNTAVQGNTTLTVTAGTNLSGGGTITLGTGGSATLNVVSSPTFTNLTVTAANAVTLGTATSATGAIVFQGSGNSNTLTLAGPTSPVAGNFTLSMPAITASATLCSTNSVCSGYAPASGSANYIQNTTSLQSSSNFWISGTGRVDGTLNTNAITGTSGDLTIQAASASNLYLDAGTTGAVNLGTSANNKTINIGVSGATANTTTVNIATSTGAAQTVNIGSTNSGSSVSVQGNNLSFQTSSSSQGSLFKTTTNSSAALQVQNSAGDQIFNITTNAKTNLLSNPSFETNTTSPWATVNGGTIALSRVTSQSYAQTASMQVAISTATQWAGAKYPVSLTNGQSYTMSFMVKSSSGTTTIDAGYSRDGTFANEIDCVAVYPTIYTTGWTRFSCTFTAGVPTGSPYVYIETPVATASTFWIDNVQLTQTTSDNGAYYSGQIDFTGAAISGQLAIQPANDSTSVFQIYSSTGAEVMQADTINKQVMVTKLVVADDFTNPTKSYRVRVAGSGIDLESAGTGVAGEMWLSGWTAPNFAGSQVYFMRMSSASRLVMVGNGSGSGTPTLLALGDKNDSATDPTGSGGAMYYNSFSGVFRCYENGEWRNCMSSVRSYGLNVLQTTTTTSPSALGNFPGTSSLTFTKLADNSKLKIDMTATMYTNTSNAVAVFAIRVNGTDIQCQNVFGNPSIGAHPQANCHLVVSSVPKGSQTLQIRWRDTGGGTLYGTTANADWTSMTVQETD